MGNNTDSKVHVAPMGPAWVLSAPGGPNVGPMNFAIKEQFKSYVYIYKRTLKCISLIHIKTNRQSDNRNYIPKMDH